MQSEAEPIAEQTRMTDRRFTGTDRYKVSITGRRSAKSNILSRGRKKDLFVFEFIQSFPDCLFNSCRIIKIS